MVHTENFSLCIGSKSLHLSKIVINWLILTWTWISVANVLELRFKIPFMDSLNHGKACSSHEFFMPKRISVEILWYFQWSLCQDYLHSLPQHMIFSDLRQKIKWKHKFTVSIITFASGVCLHSQLVYQNRSINCSVVLWQHTSWPIPRRAYCTLRMCYWLRSFWDMTERKYDAVTFYLSLWPCHWRWKLQFFSQHTFSLSCISMYLKVSWVTAIQLRHDSAHTYTHGIILA